MNVERVDQKNDRMNDRWIGVMVDRWIDETLVQVRKIFCYLVKTNLNLIFCFEKKKTVDTQSWKIGTTTTTTTTA